MSASRFARFDTFTKSREHIQVKTLGGATLSAVAFLLMLVLVVNELVAFTSKKVEHHLLVDTSQGERDVEIRFDIVFHVLKCTDLDVKVEDSKGMQYDPSHIVAHKVPMTDGVEVYGDQASATGCRVYGVLGVKKVAGNFHILGGGRTMMPVFDPRLGFGLNPADFSKYNASHTVRSLTFGPAFPGQLSPLNGVSSEPTDRPAMYQHYIKVVPTVYEQLDGTLLDSNQFSASDFAIQMAPAEGVVIQPGVWFRYDFSPIMVRVVEVRPSLAQFLVNLCAILGGAFALSGVVDQVWHRTIGSGKAD